MRKILCSLLCLFVICLLASCDKIVLRKECLNYENFYTFYYNNNKYTLPENYYDITSKYDFYGKKHQIGYTIGFYGKPQKTYVLDSDTEENILFQKYNSYCWLKEGFNFPDINELDVTKLLINKLDSDGFYTLKEKEYTLEEISIDELFVEYTVNPKTESFLNDTNNFLRFSIQYIYDDYIITNYYERLTIYKNKIFFEKYNELEERKIYVLNDKYASSFYECVLSIS